MFYVWRVLLRFVALVLLISFASGAGWAQGVPAPVTLPQGGQVSAGSATIQQGGTAVNPQMTITQQSDRAVINWQSFNLGRDASVQFQQPSASSVTLSLQVFQHPLHARI
jgi:large exoprotein involved in heme utilization and adhesion